MDQNNIFLRLMKFDDLLKVKLENFYNFYKSINLDLKVQQHTHSYRLAFNSNSYPINQGYILLGLIIISKRKRKN